MPPPVVRHYKGMDEIDDILAAIEPAEGEPERVHIAPAEVPAYVQRLRRLLKEQARIVKRSPNTEDAEIAMVKRDTAIGMLKDLPAEDPLLRAEIAGLVGFYGRAG